MSFIRKNISFLILFLVFSIISIPANASKIGCFVHLVNVDKPISLDKIKNHYTAYDSLDGDITNKITFKTDYDETNPKIGKYELLVTITNSKKKTSSQTDIILVRDFIKPTISSISENIIIDIGIKPFLDSLIDNLVLSDNIDILESNSLKIEGIDLNNIPLGISNINVYCIDSSTNKSNILNLNVIVINSLKKIDYTLKTNEKLSKDQVINHLIENEIIPNTYDTIILESSYFNKDSNFGMHTAYVILKSKTEETSYSFIIEYIEKENEFDQDLVLTIIISIFVLELIIYVKRH